MRPRQLGVSSSEQLWGVQVSSCTIIARRVELREMLADVVIPLMGDRICAPRWKDFQDKHHVVENLRGSNFVSWIQNLPQHLQHQDELIDAFYHTKFDRATQNSVIACPPSVFRCFRMPCSNDHSWTNIHRDSDTSNCFAYMTNQCLETDDNKCRGPTEGP
jgi:hypothetical protein